MAVITPQSDVYLLKVPLEINDINQLTFSNATAQYNYFSSLPKLTVDNFTYQRKDGTIRFPENFDDLISYNYVMYRNDAYSNKWFYAFITGMEYLNDNVTAIAIKTDVWQTWQFDLTYKRCFIEREHVNDDTIGKHTLPENFETGEYVLNGTPTNFGINQTIGDYCLVIDVSMIENPGTNQTLTYSWTGSQTTPTQFNNGIPTGLYHIVLGYNSSIMPSPRDLIDVYDKAGLGNAIQNVYILPKVLLGSVQTGLTIETTGSAPVGSVGGLAMPTYSTGVTNIATATYTRPSTINGYAPKNNKMFCYPYNFINVSNNAGTTLPYRYEDFSSGVSFTVEGVLTPSGEVKAKPDNYKNIASTDNAYDYSINGAKYPTCGWTTDSYTNWQTQMALNQRVEMENAGISTIANIIRPAKSMSEFMGNAGIGMLNYLEKAQSLYAQQGTANVVPDQVHGNLNSGDIVWSKLKSQFTFLPMSIKREYAECIDEFWNVFGYRVNRVKLPNITGRRNWNYVKTVGCYIEADIPQGDLQEIKEMFDKGITLWHNPTTFMDYSQTNDILT